MWNEEFTLHTFPEQSKTLEISIWDRDVGRDEFMGQTSIDLNTLTPEKTHKIIKELEAGEGTIQLIVTVTGTATGNLDSKSVLSDLKTYEIMDHTEEEEKISQKYVSSFYDLGLISPQPLELGQ